MENIITPEFRASYPNIITPKMNDLSKEMEYSVIALFPKGADLSALKKQAADAVKEKWPAGAPAGLRSPFRDQGEKVVKDKTTGVAQTGPDGKPVLALGHEAGAIFMNFKAKQKPGLVGPSNQAIIDPSEIYGGVWLRAQVRAYTYGGPGTKFTPGVAFGLQNVQKLRDGEPLGGRMKPEDAFEPVAGADGTGNADATSIF